MTEELFDTMENGVMLLKVSQDVRLSVHPDGKYQLFQMSNSGHVNIVHLTSEEGAILSGFIAGVIYKDAEKLPEEHDAAALKYLSYNSAHKVQKYLKAKKDKLKPKPLLTVTLPSEDTLDASHANPSTADSNDAQV